MHLRDTTKLLPCAAFMNVFAFHVSCYCRRPGEKEAFILASSTDLMNKYIQLRSYFHGNHHDKCLLSIIIEFVEGHEPRDVLDEL